MILILQLLTQGTKKQDIRYILCTSVDQLAWLLQTGRMLMVEVLSTVQIDEVAMCCHAHAHRDGKHLLAWLLQTGRMLMVEVPSTVKDDEVAMCCHAHGHRDGNKIEDSIQE